MPGTFPPGYAADGTGDADGTDGDAAVGIVGVTADIPPTAVCAPFTFVVFPYAGAAGIADVRD